MLFIYDVCLLEKPLYVLEPCSLGGGQISLTDGK